MHFVPDLPATVDPFGCRSVGGTWTWFHPVLRPSIYIQYLSLYTASHISCFNHIMFSSIYSISHCDLLFWGVSSTGKALGIAAGQNHRIRSSHSSSAAVPEMRCWRFSLEVSREFRVCLRFWWGMSKLSGPLGLRTGKSTPPSEPFSILPQSCDGIAAWRSTTHSISQNCVFVWRP